METMEGWHGISIVDAYDEDVSFSPHEHHLSMGFNQGPLKTEGRRMVAMRSMEGFRNRHPYGYGTWEGIERRTSYRFYCC